MAFGPARLRLWECHSTGYAATARGALNAYYAACWDHPRVQGVGPEPANFFGDGRLWYQVVEFMVVHAGGRIGFIAAGQPSAGARWRTVGGEGSGP